MVSLSGQALMQKVMCWHLRPVKPKTIKMVHSEFDSVARQERWYNTVYRDTHTSPGFVSSAAWT